MADTVTPNYNLTKPEVGGSNDTWGDKLNANMDAIDTAMKAIDDAVANKAPLADADLTGNPTAPTQAAGNNSTRIATTAFVAAALAAIDLSEYAALAGAVFTGSITAAVGGGSVILKDPVNSGNAASTYISFRGNDDVELGWVGDGSPGSGDISITSRTGKASLNGTTTTDITTLAVGNSIATLDGAELATKAYADTKAGFYTGSTTATLDLPIGHLVLMRGNALTPNGTVPVYQNVSGGYYQSAASSTLSGTWRSRGNFSDGALMQRVA